MIVNFVVRRVKKTGAGMVAAGHMSVQRGAEGRRRHDASSRPRSAADDVAFLQYTGGTTGVSKGATLLHRNVLANVAQIALWLDDAYTVEAAPGAPRPSSARCRSTTSSR